VPRCGPAGRLVEIQTVLARHQDPLPVRLSVEHVFVPGAHRPELQQGKTQVVSRIVGPLLVHQGRKSNVATVQGFRVLAQAIPDPNVAISRPHVRLPSRPIMQHVDPLHVLQGNAPVGSVLRNHDLQLGKSVIDLIVARKSLTCVWRRQERVNTEPIDMRLHVEADRSSRAHKSQDETLDEARHEVVSKRNVVRVRLRDWAPGHHLEDAPEEPQGSIGAIPSERKDQRAIELVAIAPPPIPVGPFIPRASQNIYRMVLSIQTAQWSLQRAGSRLSGKTARNGIASTAPGYSRAGAMTWEPMRAGPRVATLPCDEPAMVRCGGIAHPSKERFAAACGSLTKS
jgi:hypothetical protein